MGQISKWPILSRIVAISRVEIPEDLICRAKLVPHLRAETRPPVIRILTLRPNPLECFGRHERFPSFWFRDDSVALHMCYFRPCA